MKNTIETERFMLFAGRGYYPSGGWDDYQGSFFDFNEANQAAVEIMQENKGYSWWWHIVDVESKKIITNGHND